MLPERDTKPTPAKKKTPTPPKKPKPGSGGSKGSGSSGSGSRSTSSRGGGGGGGVKKTNDKPQVAALRALLGSKGFKAQLTAGLANINTAYTSSMDAVKKSYGERTSILGEARTANDKAEGAASQANLGNRARESADILANAAIQGAGETDTLKAKTMSLRNWSANQGEVARSFHDTLASNNSAIGELNADTWQSQYNLTNQMLGDTEQKYANFYNQSADAATQLGNALSNPYSNAYSKKGAKKAWALMKKYAAASWNNPGVSASVKDWKGDLQPGEAKLNNSVFVEDQGESMKRPEGSTLQAWG